MTKPELDETDGAPSMLRYYGHIVGWSLLLCVPIFALGVMAASLDHLEEGGGLTDYVLIAAAVTIIAGSVYLLWRWRPDFTMGEPRTPRGNRMRWVLIAIAVVSALIAVPIVSTPGPDGSSHLLFSNGPVPPEIALVSLASWALLMPPLVLFSRRNADEHKLGTQDFGMMVGFQAFALAAPVWWMGWRGGFLPQPDVMILFVATMAISVIATIWKQSV